MEISGWEETPQQTQIASSSHGLDYIATPRQESDHHSSQELVSIGSTWMSSVGARPLISSTTQSLYLSQLGASLGSHDGTALAAPGEVQQSANASSSQPPHQFSNIQQLTSAHTLSSEHDSNSRSLEQSPTLVPEYLVTQDSPRSYNHSISTPRRIQRTNSNHRNSNSPYIPPTTQDNSVPGFTAHSEQTQPLTQLSSQQPHARIQNEPTPSHISYETEEDKQLVSVAAECLHAHDYPRMIQVLSRATKTVAVCFGLGLAHIKLKNYPNSSEMFTMMLEKTSSLPGMSNNSHLALYYLGEIEVAYKQYLKAASLFGQAVAQHARDTVAEKRYRINPPSKAILYSKQGSALRQGQKVMSAVKAYKNAVETAETSNDKLAAHTSLGNLYQSVGENASALEEYKHSIALAEERRDYISLGWAHGNMGNAYLGLHQKDKALNHLEKSLDLTIEHEPDPKAIGRAYNNLGTAYQSLNDLTRAEEFYDLALSQAIYGSDIPGQARVYGNFGNLLMLQKKYDSAIVHYSEALSIGTDRSTRSTAFHNRGCASYEQAEAEKKALLDPKPEGVVFEITYSGPNTTGLPSTPILQRPIAKKYEQGRDDLIEVVKYHEETHHTIKGSSHGLTLSVSLSETNSRTFHRLQDCLYNLRQNDLALEYAEQSRARSLGELLLQRKSKFLTNQLTSPLSVDQIRGVIKSNDTDVVLVSYTGARLLVWIHTPLNGDIVTNMFQVSLEEDQFEGKSLDYFLRYTLNERLIEEQVEMYAYCSYDDSPQLSLLNELFAVPLLKILKAIHGPQDVIRDVILIPDSYTNLMPVVAFVNTATQHFLGDHLRFRYMPSCLTMGVLSQFPEVVVEVSEESQRFCVVGNPKIPAFKYQGETWNLGKLPYAAKEAEWVAHILKCGPTLREQATKMLVLSMINSAKVIHLATHGSASSGFLAFAGMASSRSQEVADDKLVLLYPEEVEKLSISPALVVLSSCDSGRGTVKADGIQGMARAFILAGAQSVLTTLWRVPDESACTFMMFFYQYLMDGCKGSEALHKAILSVRSFRKYARYIHWSGYQLTGRDITFRVELNEKDRLIRSKFGGEALFPRLEVVKALETAFIEDPTLPTDVQLIHGQHGMEPSEPVLNFIAKHHSHFSGGIFWVNGSCEDLIQGAESYVKQALNDTAVGSTLKPTLLILDNITAVPQTGVLKQLLKSRNTHIVVIVTAVDVPPKLTKEIDTLLVRGTTTTQLKSLTDLHSHQRIVHSILKDFNFIPRNREQHIFCEIVDQTGGFPCVVDITSSLLKRFVIECEERSDDNDFLDEFSNRVVNVKQNGEEPSLPDSTGSPSSNDKRDQTSEYVSRLVGGFDLPRSDLFLLSSLSAFGSAPIPGAIIDMVQSIVMLAKSETDSPSRQFTNLLSSKLLRVYPSVVIAAPSGHTPQTTHHDRRQKSSPISEYEFYYVPQLVCDTLKERMKEDKDRLFAVATAYTALDRYLEEHRVHQRVGEHHCVAGLAQLLLDNNTTMVTAAHTHKCYQEIFRVYLSYRSIGSDFNNLPVGHA